MKHWIVRIVRFLFGLVGYNISIYTGGGSFEMYWSKKARKNERRSTMTVDEFTRAVTTAKYDYEKYMT